jgi:hypothetical protein
MAGINVVRSVGTALFLRGVFALIVAVSIVCAAGSVRAQAVSSDSFKPLPKYDSIPLKELAEQTRLYEDVPDGDGGLRYSIRIPNDWEQEKDLEADTSISLNDKIFGELARFYGPVRVMGYRSSVQVKAVELSHQLTAEQWFLQHLMANGYTIEGFEVLSENRVEALLVYVHRGISYVVRAAAEIKGKNVVLVEYILPIENWEEERNMQDFVVSSFSMREAVVGDVEALKVFQFLDIAEIKYPQSWQLRSTPIRSIDRMDMELLNLSAYGLDLSSRYNRATMDGKIDVKLVSVYAVESLEQEIETLKAELKKSGLHLRTEIPTHETYKFHDLFEFGKVTAHKATDDSEKLLNYELWLSIMFSGDYYYFITLLTPSREDDFQVWSRNVETYKQVLEAAEPQPDSNLGQ